MSTSSDIAEMSEWIPEVHEQLIEIPRTLERHDVDMQGALFIVEEGRP